MICCCSSPTCEKYGCQRWANIPPPQPLNFVGYSHPISLPEKKPYKCPVCDGKGKNYIDPAKPLSGFEAMLGQRDINGIQFLKCDPCKGEGIIWG